MVWLVIGYLVCAFICYVMLFAYVEGDFPSCSRLHYKEHMTTSLLFSMALGVFGPLGIVMAFLMTAFAHYGFKVK